MMHIIQCTHTHVWHIFWLWPNHQMIRQQEEEDAIKLVCIFYTVHTIPCASYTVGSGHTMCIIYSISYTAWYPKKICFLILVLYRRPCLLLIPYGQSALRFVQGHRHSKYISCVNIEIFAFPIPKKLTLFTLKRSIWDIIQHWRQDNFQTGKRKAARHH